MRFFFKWHHSHTRIREGCTSHKQSKQRLPCPATCKSPSAARGPWMYFSIQDAGEAAPVPRLELATHRKCLAGQVLSGDPVSTYRWTRRARETRYFNAWPCCLPPPLLMEPFGLPLSLSSEVQLNQLASWSQVPDAYSSLLPRSCSLTRHSSNTLNWEN